MTKTKIALVAAMITLAPGKAKAEDGHEQLVHFTAHFGASYALQTTFYGFNRRVLKMSKPAATGVAALETLAIGLAYKLATNAPAESTATSMAQNTMGVVGAIGTAIMFEF